MGYRELPLPTPRPPIVIDRETYDVDYFGMDDGRREDPDAAFRFLFQIGQGYMIYLYVIQAGARGRHRHFFHTFWQKDCAVVEVEMEEWGPPTEVRAATLDLPLVYRAVELSGPPGEGVQARRFAIRAQRFRASFADPDADELVMSFELADASGAVAHVTWSRRDAWQLELPGEARRPLAESERLCFDEPDPASIG